MILCKPEGVVVKKLLLIMLVLMLFSSLPTFALETEIDKISIEEYEPDIFRGIVHDYFVLHDIYNYYGNLLWR